MSPELRALARGYASSPAPARDHEPAESTSAPRPFGSAGDPARAALALVLAWAAALATLAAAMLALREGTGLAVVAAVLLFIPALAIAQNHLQSLFHEGAHRMLARRIPLNDFLTDLLCGVPTLQTARPYRFFHLAHHRRLLSDRDPEIEFYASQGWRYIPLPPARRLAMLARDVSGWHFAKFFVGYQRYLRSAVRRGELPAARAPERLALTLWAAAAAALVATPTGRLALALWLLPQPTLLFLLLKLQGYAEHTGGRSSLAAATRVIRPGVLARVAIFPLGEDRHLSHHRWPRVPWHRLPRP